jgi:hypothetical protein
MSNSGQQYQILLRVILSTLYETIFSHVIDLTTSCDICVTLEEEKKLCFNLKLVSCKFGFN